ncbi:hypothetical protein TNCV_1620311 [Trichonephila clavipes]|nr:hypothetical protein TNCV_1620311 [Trichonephila clavipes]
MSWYRSNTISNHSAHLVEMSGEPVQSTFECLLFVRRSCYTSYEKKKWRQVRVGIRKWQNSVIYRSDIANCVRQIPTTVKQIWNCWAQTDPTKSHAESQYPYS